MQGKDRIGFDSGEIPQHAAIRAEAPVRVSEMPQTLRIDDRIINQ
jgi:hypothetical protein